MTLRSPLTILKGVGPQLAAKLARLGLNSVQDVLFHLPLRYQDRTRIHPMRSLRPHDEVLVEGEVQASDVHFGKRRALLVRVSDGSGSMMLRFFHFNAAQKNALSKGTLIRCFGEVRQGPSMLEMIHPEYKQVAPNEPLAVDEHLTPVYPATEGVSQKTLRMVAEQVLPMLDKQLEEYLPLECLANRPGLVESLRYVHAPPPEASVLALQEGSHPAQQRLAFEELLAHNLCLREVRFKVKAQDAPMLEGTGDLTRRLLAALPYELTGAQRRVSSEVDHDIAQASPMQRLVQGDVGSGKTIVAALAVLRAVESGYQAAVMAPTELLAEQHLRNFKAWLEPLGVDVIWLVGKQGVKAKRESLAAIAEGAAVAVGTHALFQDEVVFSKLGLVVVDEQHRFGVHQRLALKEKGTKNGYSPHQLIMTATPIPRTLAMTAYADLDTSVIDELPPGRIPVETVVLSDQRRADVVERVNAGCSTGRQAYWVCTLIEESEVLQCEAAEDTANMLVEALPELKVGLVHGRMKSADKETVMAKFKAGALNLLVATTVIEVGVDVPNASLMIIENAERLGLAQLHQLRGRVGRGSASSSCVLMYHKPLSQQARTRLQAMRETNDGFEIARRDLEIRGPGEVLGTRQSGLLRLRVADLQRDEHMIPEVAELAERLLIAWPDRVPKIISRWVGDAQRYGEV